MKNSEVVGKYIIIKDLNFSDFMKNENGEISIYDSYEAAYNSAWINEPEDALILKIESNYIETI